MSVSYNTLSGTTGTASIVNFSNGDPTDYTIQSGGNNYRTIGFSLTNGASPTSFSITLSYSQGNATVGYTIGTAAASSPTNFDATIDYGHGTNFNTLVQVAGASSSPGTVWTNITSSIGVNGTFNVTIPAGYIMSLFFSHNNKVTATITSLSPTSCYNEGTLILTLNDKNEEEYIEIERLKKGNVVKTYNQGFKKIIKIGKKYMINNPKKMTSCMYKLEKTDSNGLIRDLLVTGGHAILVDSLDDDSQDPLKVEKIMDKYLSLAGINKNFKKIEEIEPYTYYHLVLENEDKYSRYGIWANGILSESTSEAWYDKQGFLEDLQ